VCKTKGIIIRSSIIDVDYNEYGDIVNSNNCCRFITFYR